MNTPDQRAVVILLSFLIVLAPIAGVSLGGSTASASHGDGIQETQAVQSSVTDGSPTTDIGASDGDDVPSATSKQGANSRRSLDSAVADASRDRSEDLSALRRFEPTTAAVEHVSDYESESIPAATVVKDRTDLVSLIDRTTSAGPATIREELSGLGLGPPQVVERTDGTSIVELYSWSRDQGILLEWEITVEDGQPVHRSATAVSVGLGAPANFEKFSPPEGATVIQEATVQHMPGHQKGNLSVSNNHVTVFEDGTAESTDISLSDFGPGDEQVDVDITIEGTEIGNRSGDPLEISTDANGNGSVTFVPPSSLYSGRTCINATSDSTTREWCITDRTTGDDNNTMDDERGLLTIEEAKEATASGGGETITYVAKYTDQNLDSVIDGDPNLTKTENDRQTVVDRYLDAVTAANEKQIGQLGFDRYLGEKFDRNSRVPVQINDGTWDFHGVRSTKAFWVQYGDGSVDKRITSNPNIGYGDNVTLHARHIMAHEHFHLVQYSYKLFATNTGGNWYIEGMARFMETLADPDVVNNDDSLFFADNVNGVNGYLRNPDRQSLANFSYDYAIFWLYLYNQGGIDAVEQALFELNEVSGDPNEFAQVALNRTVEKDANIEQDSYRELMADFHVAVFEATHSDGRLDFVTDRDWSVYMDPVDTEDYRELHTSSDEVDSTVDTVGTWGADYIEYGTSTARAHDGLYYTINRTDLYTRTVRMGPNSDRPISFPNSIVTRGNLTAGTTEPHPPAPNNTVYHGSLHDKVGVVVMSLGAGKKTYNLTGRSDLTAHRLNNSIDEQDETAIYLIPVNQPRPGNLGGQYGAHGDIFVSVYPSTIPSRSRTGGPRNLTADLTLAAGQPTTASVKQLPTSERIHKTEFVADIDNSESSVWKLMVEEKSNTPTDPGNFFVHSNYLDGGPNDGVPEDQLFGMPTEVDLTPEDLDAGSTTSPNQVSVVVNVDNGDNRYRHSPFPNPDPSHFLVRLGSTPIPQRSLSVATLGQGKYRVTFTPPGGQFAIGQHQLCVAFQDTKFGVTEVTPETCGPDVIFPVNPPGDGTSIVFDPPTLVTFDPTPVYKFGVDSGNDNDTVSLVTVGETDSTTSITTTRLGGQRDELKAAFEDVGGSLEPIDGTTAIADGLDASRIQLLEADDDAPRAALLVSPGYARSPGEVEEVVDRFAEARIPIHVIATGDDPNTELLQFIADETGGIYQRAVTKADFETAFRRVDRVNGREEVLERDRFALDGFEERSFRVDATADPMVVQIDLDGELVGNTSVALRSPDEEVIEPAGRHEGAYVFRVTSPTAGTWTYDLETDQGGTVETIVTSHSTTSLRASTDKASQLGPLSVVRGPSYFPGETVRLGASLVGPEGGLEDAAVTGTLTLPNGEQKTIEFVSQGNGSYGVDLAMTEELTEVVQGAYTLTVTAKQGDVVRERTLVWTVRASPFKPEVSIGDLNIAPGGNGQVAVTIDRVPKGFESFNGTVCVSGDTGEGAITDIASDHSLSVVDRTNRCITFLVTDESGQVEAGAESVTVATLTLSEPMPGEAALVFGPPEPLVLDDGSQRYPTELKSGTLVVEPTETETVQIVLDGTPNGLYRYEFSLSADESVGPIVGIEGNADGAEWLADYTLVDGGIGEKNVRIDAIDFENETDESGGPLLLAEITYATDDVELTDALSLEVLSLRNDNGTIEGNGPIGDPIDPDRLLVGEKPPAGASTPPDVSAEGDTIPQGSFATVNATFTDDDLTDTHTAEIDWDDGSTTDVEVDQGAGYGSILAEHRYDDVGEYEVSVTVTDDDGASGTDTAVVTVENVAPDLAVSLNDPVDEGSLMALTATIEDPGVGDVQNLTVDWGDGNVSEVEVESETGTARVELRHTYLDDGTYNVTATVQDANGGQDQETTSATIENVPPTVTASGDEIAEGKIANVTANLTDPGIEDTHSATVDWGDGTTSDVSVDQGAGEGSVSASHEYGDNGTYPITVTVTDDDGGSGEATTEVSVANRPPVVDLDTSATVGLAGDDVFLGTAGLTQNHTATATEPGSDDLRFAWSNGTTTIYYNDGAMPEDPPLSPGGTFPFIATDTGMVTYEEPGVYDLVVTVTDDDGGRASANATKVIRANYTAVEGVGFWRHEYSDRRGQKHSDSELTAFLAVTDRMSAVFNENVSAESFDSARDALTTRQSTMRERASAQLLAAWLNFASGRIGWTDSVDEDGDGTGDRAFNEVMAEVEAIVLDDGATRSELERAKDLAEAVNGQLEDEENGEPSKRRSVTPYR
ncbi:MAG: PKD domain-containing protein [Halovenus sp.]